MTAPLAVRSGAVAKPIWAGGGDGEDETEDRRDPDDRLVSLDPSQHGRCRTAAGPMANGAGGRPAVILVNTKPGTDDVQPHPGTAEGLAEALREPVEPGLRRAVEVVGPAYPDAGDRGDDDDPALAGGAKSVRRRPSPPPPAR